VPGAWENVSGTQRQGLFWHKVAGTWQRITGYTKVSGAWRLFSGGSAEYVGKVADTTGGTYATPAPNTVGAIVGDFAIAFCRSGVAPVSSGAAVWTSIADGSGIPTGVFVATLDATDIANPITSGFDITVTLYRGVRSLVKKISFLDSDPQPVAGYVKNVQYAGMIAISQFDPGSGSTVATSGVSFDSRATGMFVGAKEYILADYLAPHPLYPDSGTFTGGGGTPPIRITILEMRTT
jgi:hypothetical protein